MQGKLSAAKLPMRF